MSQWKELMLFYLGVQNQSTAFIYPQISWGQRPILLNQEAICETNQPILRGHCSVRRW